MSLTYTKIPLMAAGFGVDNPLPDMQKGGDIHAKIPIGKSLTEDEAKYMGWGKVYGIAPYPLQDTYDRDRRMRDVDAVVLENEHLQATFLPGLGGRLWKLWDKDLQRDLVYENPILQPGNLALRNAWFAGGVEFNIGMTGHTPFTCAPLFTTTWKKSDGTEVLRMYEYERIRRVTYRIDAFLPEGSRYLYLSMEIVNTRNEEVPIYWWSNIAAEETPTTRVIVPAAKAYRWGYGGGLEKQSVPVTEADGFDLSYSSNSPYSLDLFFDIVPPQRPWISVLDEKGTGLIQCSTRRLIGRKLFMWGTGSGGNRWQEHLSGPGGRRYLEIQAGLAHTQLECLPLPANAHWRWLEAYGAMQADPVVIHGSDYPAAARLVNSRLDASLPLETLEDMLAEMEKESPKRLAPKTFGAGWAALEELRRGSELNDELCFDGSLGIEQEPWVNLLKSGTFPAADPAALPCGWMTQPEWVEPLKAAEPNWYTELHLGLIAYAAGDLDKAEAHWTRSDALSNNAWALRNLARLAVVREDPAAAAELYRKALALQPAQRHLLTEGLRVMIDAGLHRDALELLSALPEDLAAIGRIRLLKVRAMLAAGKPAEAMEILNDTSLTVADYQEGEDSFTGVWKDAAMKLTGLPEEDALKSYPLPAHLDYRMRT